MKNYRVIHKDKVYKILFVYPSGYMEIRDPETRVKGVDLRVIHFQEYQVDYAEQYLSTYLQGENWAKVIIQLRGYLGS